MNRKKFNKIGILLSIVISIGIVGNMNNNDNECICPE